MLQSMGLQRVARDSVTEQQRKPRRLPGEGDKDDDCDHSNL